MRATRTRVVERAVAVLPPAATVVTRHVPRASLIEHV